MERVKSLIARVGLDSPELRATLLSLVRFIHDLAFAAASGRHPQKRLFTVQEACTYLGCSDDALRRLIQTGQLPSVRFDRRLYVDIYDLDTLIERCKDRPEN